MLLLLNLHPFLVAGPHSQNWIYAAYYTLVKELKVKHLIFSNLKTLDRYLVLSNQHQTLMSNRFETYLVCLALVVSSCETLTKLAMLKP